MEQQDSKPLVIRDVTFWSPEGENEQIEGTYIGFSPFEMTDKRTGEVETRYFAIIDEGNEDYYALPSWYNLQETFRANIEKMVERKTKIKVVFLGKRMLEDDTPLVMVDCYFDGEKVGRHKILSGKEMAQLLLRPARKQITQ